MKEDPLYRREIDTLAKTLMYLHDMRSLSVVNYETRNRDTNDIHTVISLYESTLILEDGSTKSCVVQLVFPNSLEGCYLVEVTLT